MMAAQDDLVEVVARFEPQARQDGTLRGAPGGLRGCEGIGRPRRNVVVDVVVDVDVDLDVDLDLLGA